MARKKREKSCPRVTSDWETRENGRVKGKTTFMVFFKKHRKAPKRFDRQFVGRCLIEKRRLTHDRGVGKKNKNW